MAPSSPDTVYTTIFQPGNSSTNPMLQRFLTTDAGNSWSMLSLPGPAERQDYRSWHVVLGVDPNAPNVVYANATGAILRRERGFRSDLEDAFHISTQALHEDPVNAYFDSTGALAYVGDRGIQRVVAPLEPNPTFVSRQGNLGNFLFYNVTLDPRNPRRGFGVSQDQLMLVQFSGPPMWIYASTGNEVGKVLIDPHDPAVVYNLAQTTTLVTRSTDGGSRWTAANSGIDMSEFPGTPDQDAFNAFALDEHQPSRLVLGGQSVWQTLNSGANWTRISQQGLSKGANVTAVAIAPSQRETLYAATSDGRFWATFDGGTTAWVERDQGLPVELGNETLDIVIDPAHPNHVFIQMTPGKAGQPRGQTAPIGDGRQGRIWVTNDGGLSWTRLDNGIPTNLAVRSLAVDWLRHSALYAGTDRGVFLSTDLGTNWALFGQGLPRTVVHGLQILPRYRKLVAATFGPWRLHGLARTPIASTRLTPQRVPHPFQEKELLFMRQRRFPSSCRCRECDHVGLLCCDRREGHALRLCDAVLAAQVPVGFHCQRAAVLVSKPARNGRNVHAAFDAARCEQMPQIVMRDAIRADFFARAIKRLLAFADAEYFRV